MSLLVSKRKRYLSGSDWVLNTLDHLMKSSFSSGNVCQIVLILEAPPAEQSLRKSLNTFIRKFPVLSGAVARDFKLTPYWKIPAAMERDVCLKASQVSSRSLFAALVTNVNASFHDDNSYIDFHLFTTNEQSALAMRFDHRLFDARGAESFLNLFQQSLDDNSLSGEISFTTSAELTEWRSKFSAGRNVNRALRALAKTSPRSLSLRSASGRGFNYRLLTFDKEETATIYEKAYREAGYLMESPFFLAVITQAVHELFASRSDPGTGACYLIPVTMDLRPGKDPLQELFFNHMSYLFYQVPLEQADDLKGTILLLKQQMYDQVKSGLPRDLAEASLLTRIVPLPVFGKLLTLPMDGKLATFTFSHLGKSYYLPDRFMGSPTENMFHMPRIPQLPGLGFYSSRFGDRLNLIIAYLDGIMTDDEVATLLTGIRRKFGVVPE